MLGEIYCTTYCNKGHRLSDGKPIQHECRILPQLALFAEQRGDYDTAIRILSNTPARYMRRGVRA